MRNVEGRERDSKGRFVRTCQSKQLNRMLELQQKIELKELLYENAGLNLPVTATWEEVMAASYKMLDELEQQ